MYHKGFISLAILMFISIIGLAIGASTALTSLTSQEIVRNSMRASQSYYASESGIEDAVYRIKNALPYASNYTLSVGSSQATLTISSLSDSIMVDSRADRSNAIKNIQSRLKLPTQNAQFFYGVQVGDAGLIMDNNARVNGNVYSNGNIDGGTITGDATVATGIAQNPSVQWTSGNADHFFATSSSNRDIAQSFTATASGTLPKVSVYLGKVGNPSSNITLRITADNGNKPATSSLASATIASSQIGASSSWIDVTFSSPPTLTNETTYWIVLDYSGNSATNYWNWRKDTTDGYANNTGKETSNWNSGSATWTNVGGDLLFNVWVGGVSTSIANATIGQTGRANQFINTTISGSPCPNPSCIIDNPSAQPMPISDEVIQNWRDSASQGVTCGTGIANCDGANYTLQNGESASIGPMKIPGNLVVQNNAILTLTGTVWVLGNITIQNDCTVKLLASYGATSGIIVTDGTATISNNCTFQGSGTQGSYIMLLSANNAPTSNVINVQNNSFGVMYYASKGKIRLQNNAAAKEIVGYGIHMDNNATVTYETGLANVNFSSGPGGSFQILDWKEK